LPASILPFWFEGEYVFVTLILTSPA